MRKIITYALVPVVVPIIIFGAVCGGISEFVDWFMDTITRWKNNLP